MLVFTQHWLRGRELLGSTVSFHVCGPYMTIGVQGRNIVLLVECVFRSLAKGEFRGNLVSAKPSAQEKERKHHREWYRRLWVKKVKAGGFSCLRVRRGGGGVSFRCKSTHLKLGSHVSKWKVQFEMAQETNRLEEEIVLDEIPWLGWRWFVRQWYRRGRLFKNWIVGEFVCYGQKIIIWVWIQKAERFPFSPQAQWQCLIGPNQHQDDLFCPESRVGIIANRERSGSCSFYKLHSGKFPVLTRK